MKKLPQVPRAFSIMLMMVLVSAISQGQIWGPEGLNMPGHFNGFTNPPVNKPAFGGIQVAGGTLLLNTELDVPRYQTLIHIDATGADTSAGTYGWLFTSGPPPAGYYNNKWAGVTVAMNTLQTYTFNSGPDNSVTVADGKWYTVNYRNAGYIGTQAIWMETSAQPVTIDTVTQNPTAGNVDPIDAVTVDVITSLAPSTEELLYVRYTTDNWVTSTLTPVTMASNAGSATIPAQSGGTTVKYFVLSTTVSGLTTDYDMHTIRHNNNGGADYQYTVNAPTYTITASAGLNGIIAPSGAVIVAPAANQGFSIVANVGYFIDSVIVDGVLTDSLGSYTFVNVNANHTIHATFTQKNNVTFSVNMTKKMRDLEFLPGSGDVVTVRGSFNDWGNSTNNPDTMADGDNDSIYTITKLLKSSSSYAYKFWKTLRAGQDYENSIPDRALSLAASDTTLPVVFYNNEIILLPSVNVTFQVNMGIKMQEGAFRPDLGDVVTVRGSFNDWGNSTNNPDTLADGDNDSIYTKTISIPGGQNILYKFWKNFRFYVDYENSISDRQFLLGGSDVTIPAPFFDDDSSNQYCVTVNIVAGWNMISNPVQTENDSVRQLYPNSQFPYAFGFNGGAGYALDQTMENGVGYWGKFPASKVVTICGDPITADSIPVNAGWNMMGSITFPVDTATIVSVPPGIRSSNFFGYSAGYTATATIEPGQAYWVKASSAGHFVLEGQGTSAPPPLASSGLSGFNTLTITDANGAQQTLYFGVDETGTFPVEMFEMPPSAPQGAFDVRFESQRMLEVARNDGGRFPIAINAVYPVTVSWAMNDVRGEFSLTTGDATTALVSNSSMVIASPSASRLVLASSGVEIPTSFALSQNYPNPFNPSTMINYALPLDAFVTIKVYDILGRELATLVNEIQKTGYRNVQWNGLNASGLPVATGVYFYRIDVKSTTGDANFTSIKKMMLVK
ncbi:MAG: FlgD immunoglobulin-like domain containing protein [Bacteroidota bacterium]